MEKSIPKLRWPLAHNPDDNWQENPIPYSSPRNAKNIQIIPLQMSQNFPMGLRSTPPQLPWTTCPSPAMPACQGTSETGNISRPSAHGALTDLRNRRSRGCVPAECLEQKMLYANATVCTHRDFTLSRK